MLPEEQNPGRKLVLTETIYNLSGEALDIYVENLTGEEIKICSHRRLGTIHSSDNDKEA